MKKSKIILKKDFVIPAGTVFENCDGQDVLFCSGNYEAIKGTGKNGLMSIYIGEDTVCDIPDQFEFIED